MIKKYELVDESGRKRLRALRNFSVQGRDVNVHDLGGYVYDEKTLSQDGNCWIFSGSLEYPDVRVMDEAIVDMGINLASPVMARTKSVVISGNSRIMGPVQFTGSVLTSQAGIVWEQGGYTANVGAIPVKAADGSRIRIPVQAFGGTAGKVAITGASYEARIISIDSDGLVTSGGEWTAGGPAVTLTTTSPNFLVELRKTPSATITPADVTAAGIKITRAREATVRIFNSSIVPAYNGAVALASSILRYEVTDPSGEPYQVDIQNSYLRIECDFNSINVVRANADFIGANYTLVVTPNVPHYISGSFRNTNINTPASVNVAGLFKGRFDVSDCPNFEFSSVTFPDLASMYTGTNTFYFKSCNMPVGSAIHYYDPKVNVWDNIDFTKAMADLGKEAAADTTIVSSNVQGMYRARGNTSGTIGGLLEAASSFDGATYTGTASETYDTIIYKDCVIKGNFTVKGRNVFGGTQGGASRITNTKAEAMVIDGSFRIDGNAQVTDTSLKGTGYIGGNAELKNGVVEGYVYMTDNAKFIPAAVTNPLIIRKLEMSGNSKVLKQADVPSNRLFLKMSDNAVIDSLISTDAGYLEMSGDSSTFSDSAQYTPNIQGRLVMRDKARIQGRVFAVRGDVELVGSYLQTSAAYSVFGKRRLADVSEIAAVELPPTKITW